MNVLLTTFYHFGSRVFSHAIRAAITTKETLLKLRCTTLRICNLRRLSCARPDVIGVSLRTRQINVSVWTLN